MKYTTKSLAFLVPVTLGNGLFAQTFDFPFVYSPDDPFPEVIIGLDLIGFADINVNYAARRWKFRNHPDATFPFLDFIESASVQFTLDEHEANSLDDTGRQRLQDILAPYANVFSDFGPPSTLGCVLSPLSNSS